MSFEHRPVPTKVEVVPAGLLRNKYRVVVYAGNNEKLLFSQPYVEERQAEGLKYQLETLLFPSKDG